MAKKQDSTISDKQIKEAKDAATELTSASNGGKLLEMYARYLEIYFMDGMETPKNAGVDKDDWKLTTSPSGRNAVIGMVRLLNTSELRVTVNSKGEKHRNSDKIEAGLKEMLRVSGRFHRARIEKDANLSAVLFGPVVLQTERVDDLKKVHKSDLLRKRVEKIADLTPFLLRALPADQSFGGWGEFGLLRHLRKYKMKGDALTERWGVEASATKEYTVWDSIDLNNRVVWADGIKDNLLAQRHGMDDLNIAVRYAGGSSLFTEPARHIQSFLYAHAKGEWDKRENLFWTYLFTAIFIQGLPGPLLVFDPESVNSQTKIEVDFTGGVRKIVGKATPVEFPVIDRNVLEVKRMMDEVDAESTIYKQTLGQNIAGSTFSGMAMLSSSGLLPLQDPKEAVSTAFADSFEHILCRIKNEGISHRVLSANDIPDEYEVSVSLEPKLPQDTLRNAQTAEGLGDTVSDEWKQENLLQVTDTKAMQKQIMKEKMREMMLMTMSQNQPLMTEFLMTALGRKPSAPPSQPPMQPPMQQPMPPEMMMPEGEEEPALTPGQENVIPPPMTGPVNPPMPGG